MLDVQSTDAKAAMLLDLLRPRRIMPVLSIETVDQGLSLVGALQEAGLGMVEVTLRTEAALAAMEAIASRLRRWCSAQARCAVRSISAR